MHTLKQWQFLPKWLAQRLARGERMRRHARAMARVAQGDGARRPVRLPSSHTTWRPCPRPLVTRSPTRAGGSSGMPHVKWGKSEPCSTDAGRSRISHGHGCQQEPAGCGFTSRGQAPSPLGSSVGSMIPTLPFPASGQDSSSLTQTKTAELRDCKQPQVRSQHAQINPNAEENVVAEKQQLKNEKYLIHVNV